MKTIILYHSFSGNTRAVARKIRDICNGELVEVRPKSGYSRLSAYTLGCYRAVKGVCDPIEPETIDVADYDVIVVGTPVWASRATPVVNAAVEALAGCEGKKAVLFATCGGKEGDTLSELQKSLEKKGMIVAGQFALDRKGMEDPERICAMTAAITEAGGPA